MNKKQMKEKIELLESQVKKLIDDKLGKPKFKILDRVSFSRMTTCWESRDGHPLGVQTIRPIEYQGVIKKVGKHYGLQDHCYDVLEASGNESTHYESGLTAFKDNKS